MGATDRMRLYLDYKKISKYSFCKKMGFSNKFLDNSSNMGTDKAEIILRYYPDINIEWLISGKGKMLKESDDNKLNQSILGDNNLMAGREINNTNDTDTSRIIEEIKDLKKQVKNKDTIIGTLMKQQEQLLNQISKLTDKIS